MTAAARRRATDLALQHCFRLTTDCILLFQTAASTASRCQLNSSLSILCLVLPFQGGGAWTALESAALIASMAAVDKRAVLDWKAVAEYPGLEQRSAVRI